MITQKTSDAITPAAKPNSGRNRYDHARSTEICGSSAIRGIPVSMKVTTKPIPPPTPAAAIPDGTARSRMINGPANRKTGYSNTAVAMNGTSTATASTCGSGCRLRGPATTTRSRTTVITAANGAAMKASARRRTGGSRSRIQHPPPGKNGPASGNKPGQKELLLHLRKQVLW